MLFMEWQEVIFLVLIGLGSGFVQRVSGFGLSIFAMMFLPHFLPSHVAAATIATLFSSATTTYNAIRYRKEVSYKTALPMLCAALVLIPVAVYFASAVSARIFKVLLGVLLIIFSLYFLCFKDRISIKANRINGVLIGALSGVLGGLFSTSGPPAVLYLNSATQNKNTYFATIQFYFCITNIHATLMRVINGNVDGKILIYSAIGIVGCMAGDFIGKQVFNKLDANKLKLIIYIGMIISGIIMFF